MASVSRAPLVEADANTVGSAGTAHMFTRGWWMLKNLSTKGSLRSVSKQRPPTELAVQQLRQKLPLSVVVGGVPHMSVSALLAQVCVGPVRNIKMLESGEQPVALLEFVTEIQTSSFRSALQAGKVAVNGHVLCEMEVPPSRAQQILEMFKDVKIENPDQCRRTLEIYREVDMARSVTSSGRPCLMHTDANPVMIKRAFSTVGEVVQVRPMVYHCYVAFAIDFANTADAIRAKQLFDEETSRPENAPLPIELKFRELHGWRLEFSKDITERRIA